MLDSESTCYTCLTVNSNNLINASEADSDDVTYWDKLKFVMQGELHRGDMSGVCESCVNVLRVTFTFVRMVKSSQHTLREIDALRGGGTFEPLVEITELAESKSPKNTKRSPIKKIKLLQETPRAEGDPLEQTEGTHSGLEPLVEITELKPEEDFQSKKRGRRTRANKQLPNKKIKVTKANRELEEDEEGDERGTFEPLVEITELKSPKRRELKKINVEKNGESLGKNLPVPEIQTEKNEENFASVIIKTEVDEEIVPKEEPQSEGNLRKSKKEGDDVNIVFYNCDFCKKNFNYKPQLREHILSHSNIDYYKCRYCTRSFCSVAYRRKHHELHVAKGHFSKRYEELSDCEPSDEQIECGYCVEFARTLAEPRAVFLDTVKFKCEKCRLGFRSNIRVTQHIEKAHGDINFECDFCDRNFKRLYLLKLHLHKNHECNLFYHKAKQTKLDLIDHRPLAEKINRPFVCPICGKGFRLRNTKKRHMRVHLGIKKYVCHFCKRRFSQSYQLKLHYKKHAGDNGDKPHTCSICSISFFSYNALRRHMAMQHPDDDVPPENKSAKLVIPKIESVDCDVNPSQEFESVDVDCDVFIGNDVDEGEGEEDPMNNDDDNWDNCTDSD